MKRFAGTRIEGFFGDKPDYGELASGADTLRTKEEGAVTNMLTDTTATGINLAGEIKASENLEGAYQNVAGANTFAAGMNALGQVGGSFINAGIDAGAFGSGSATPITMDLDKYKGAWNNTDLFNGMSPGEFYTQDIGWNIGG